MGKNVWVIGDLRSRALFENGLKLVGKARDLAAELGGHAAVVLFDTPPSGAAVDDVCDTRLPAAVAADDCASHGADRVWIIENDSFDVPRADLFSPALAAVIQDKSPGLVLFPMTDFGRELAARSSGLCHCGLMADCVDIRIENGIPVGLCPAWGGRILAEITFSASQTLGFGTVQPHGFEVSGIPGSPGAIERIPATIAGDVRLPRLVSRSEAYLPDRDLSTADTVVVGGAGVGNMAGFSQIRELAVALGGQVGATRPPVLAHWVDEDRLIGQTGKSVNPRLLISVGTSGAVQYTAGIMASDTIVAINRDPNAPIFQVADIGIVADAGSFLPPLISRVQQVSMRALADERCQADTGAVSESSFGEKIRQLRTARNWSTGELAEKTGQTPEYIDQVESGQLSPPVSFLVRLAGALKIDPGMFLHKTEQAELRDMRSKAYAQRTRNYSYQTLTEGRENDHLRAFMVSIEPHNTHKPVAYKHEGEEFIFVYEGKLELSLGDNLRVLTPGESIHFNSEIPHKLKSLSNSPTRCLVVLYTV
ncbi:MAG: cupin domain-containing protein [Desulfobacteraceae bacterium]|nr:cupin domain-containing protein [Desulfobacteraceae bacterium]